LGLLICVTGGEFVADVLVMVGVDIPLQIRDDISWDIGSASSMNSRCTSLFIGLVLQGFVDLLGIAQSDDVYDRFGITSSIWGGGPKSSRAVPFCYSILDNIAVRTTAAFPWQW
jgi:hypothetical protein